MKTKIIIFLFFIALIFGCRSRSFEKAMPESQAKLEMSEEMTPPPPPAPPSESSTNIEKKIIKTAYLSIEVLNYANSRKMIDSTLKEFGAYIVSENLQNTETQVTNSINIRVPANQFEKLLAKLPRIAKKVDYQNIETQDVTEEYIDVETRLNNSRRVEQTYLKLLRRTNSMEDILKIEQKLGEIRTDIESTQGRLKYLNHQVSYSSINLNVYQTIEYRYVADKLPSFFQQLKKSLATGWKGIIIFFLFLAKLWPLWVVGTAGWFGWKYFVTFRKQYKRDRKRRKKLFKREVRVNADSSLQ